MTNPLTAVRLAEPEDAPAVLELCWAAHQERPDRSLSRPKVEAMVAGCLDATGGMIGVVDVDGDLRAMAGLIISSPWFSEDRELYDWLVFVRQDCRHLSYLSPLLRWMRRIAIKTQLPIVSGWIGDERAAAKAAAYRRHFAPYGEFYRYDPNSGMRSA